MDSSKDKVKLKEFIKNIQMQFAPCKILLFGSRARKDYWNQSDYDIIIVSGKFIDMHWLVRISAILRYWDLPFDLDVLPYTPEEFEHKKRHSSFIRSIVEKSKMITE